MTKKAYDWNEVLAKDLAEGRLDIDELDRAEQELLAEQRAYRLSQVREAQAATQTEVSERMGVSQVRVSKIERGDLSHTQLGTLESYVEAMGGKLRVVAEFEDESLTLT